MKWFYENYRKDLKKKEKNNDKKRQKKIIPSIENGKK